MNPKTLTTALLLFFALGANVHADLFLTIGSPAASYAAGDTVSIPVTARVDGLTPNPLTAYSITIDFGSDGYGLPGSPDLFSSFVASSAVGGSLTQTPTTDATTPFDFIIGWNGSVAVSSDPLEAPTTLFHLEFESSTSTPDGMYDIDFATGAIATALTSFNSNSTPITDVQLNNGQFQVSAVPEPGPASFLALGVIGFVARRKRKYTTNTRDRL